MDEDWYQIGAWITGGITFIGCYIYAIVTYGFLIGVGFGWIPSLIVAFFAGLLWPLIAFLIIVCIFFIIKASSS